MTSQDQMPGFFEKPGISTPDFGINSFSVTKLVAMRCVPIQILLILSLSISSVGCVYQGRLSIRRVWADFNTLNQPALFYEKIDHFPYHAAKVDHFRWMYNKGPNPRVPYQVIPEGALDEAFDPQSEIPAFGQPEIPPEAVRPSMMSNQPIGLLSDE